MLFMQRNKILFALITAGFIILSGSNTASQEMPPVTSDHWTTDYDGHFKKWSKRFFGVGFDWKWFKAQAIAESNLRENAKSWVGAKGIMQIVPRTFEEIQQKNPTFANINEPRWNIAAGIYYDSQMYKRWNDVRSFEDRFSFTFASYNAGRSTILNAQKVSKSEGYIGLRWVDIEAVAEKVPRWRHTETLGYVKKIHTLMNKKK
ncbi:transglycosylase SLT domain-containing protein [candidate division KSB1 bacterium]